MSPNLRLLLTILAAFVVNAALTPIITFLAHRNQWYDERNHRKIHTEDTPRLGGVGIFIGILVGTAIMILTSAGASSGLPSVLGAGAAVGKLVVHYLPIVGGMAIIFALGLIDDFRDLNAVLKFLVQIVAAALVTLGPFRVESITIPFVWYQLELGVFSYAFTVIWIVAVSNALNFIDGVDGLAGGSATISALFFALISMLVGHTVTALVAAALFGSLLGFLVYNSPPAKIFMGDSGSYTIGFALAVFPLMLSDNSGQSLDLIPAGTILAVPIIDMVTSTFRRLHRGTHPFSADREHLHHKLMDLGLETRRILAVVYGAGVVFGLAALSWYLLPANVGISIMLAVWAVAVVLAVALTRASHVRRDPRGK